MAVKAITPDEAQVAKFEKYVPEQVIEAANELIASRMDASGQSQFTLDELASAIQKHLPDETRQTLANKKWLDIEPFYRAVGWYVEFDRPGYNESYAANFRFSRARR